MTPFLPLRRSPLQCSPALSHRSVLPPERFLVPPAPALAVYVLAASSTGVCAPELSPRLSLLLSLQTAPEQFPSEEFPISESKVNLDVTFPGAAFVVVSCKESQSGFRKE